MISAWGITMSVIGLLFVSWGTTQSDNVIYRLLKARSEILWGEQVHRFFQVVGVVLMVLGMLWALGAIW